MAPVLPPSAPQTTLPGEFCQVWIESTIVASGMTGEFGMRYEGEWLQPFGTDTPVRNPRMKSGTGTLDTITIYGQRLSDMLIKTGKATQQQLSTAGFDFRLVPMTMKVGYNDSTKQFSKTLLNVYIEEDRMRLDGNSIIRSNLSFAFSDMVDI
jgi:hypothetical protein